MKFDLPDCTRDCCTVPPTFALTNPMQRTMPNVICICNHLEIEKSRAVLNTSNLPQSSWKIVELCWNSRNEVIMTTEAQCDNLNSFNLISSSKKRKQTIVQFSLVLITISSFVSMRIRVRFSHDENGAEYYETQYKRHLNVLADGRQMSFI